MQLRWKGDTPYWYGQPRNDAKTSSGVRNRMPFKRHIRWLMQSKQPATGGGGKEYWGEAPSEKMGSRRPSSQASTRCPSSASTLRRPLSQASRASSPAYGYIGDFISTTFGGNKRDQVQTASEAWTGLGPATPLSQSRAGSPQGGRVGSGANSPYNDVPSDEEVDVPDMYRITQDPVQGQPLLPHYDLWISLKGGNGTWEKRKAVVEWRLQLEEYQDSEAKRREKLRCERQMQEDAAKKKKIERAELQIRVEKETIARKRLEREEEIRKIEEKMEEERRQRLEEERQKKMHEPRPCKVCTEGKCRPCNGEGCIMTLFLAPVVNERTKSIYGQLPRGCSACGGSGDGAWWGEFVSGSGACQSCGGKGQVPAPPGGWPDCQLPF